MFLRVILWALLIYLIYRTLKNVIKLISSGSKKNEPRVEQKPKNSKYKIDSNDIIEAKFEEIDKKETEKSKENS